MESDVVVKRVFSYYKREAKKAAREFALTVQDFETLVFLTCFYCGSLPTNRLGGKRYAGRELAPYNGLDRLDNELGYTLSNVVTCCKKCNVSKHTTPLKDFIWWVEQVYSRLEQVKQIAQNGSNRT